MHARSHDIVRAAKSYVGSPYRHMGRSRVRGLDCAGLPILVLHDLGINSFETHNYSRRPNVQEYDREMARAGCRKIPFADLASGDLVRLTSPSWPVHCAVYEVDERGRGWIIHAYAPARQVRRDPYTKDVAKSVTSVWRLPEVEG